MSSRLKGKMANKILLYSRLISRVFPNKVMLQLHFTGVWKHKKTKKSNLSI